MSTSDAVRQRCVSIVYAERIRELGACVPGGLVSTRTRSRARNLARALNTDQGAVRANAPARAHAQVSKSPRSDSLMSPLEYEGVKLMSYGFSAKAQKGQVNG